jgi:hypothetical protein
MGIEKGDQIEPPYGILLNKKHREQRKNTEGCKKEKTK